MLRAMSNEGVNESIAGQPPAHAGGADPDGEDSGELGEEGGGDGEDAPIATARPADGGPRGGSRSTTAAAAGAARGSARGPVGGFSEPRVRRGSVRVPGEAAWRLRS